MWFSQGRLKKKPKRRKYEVQQRQRHSIHTRVVFNLEKEEAQLNFKKLKF
jgi:hypothetical protein